MLEIGPREYRDRWSEADEQSGRVTLLDVREDHELAVARLPQALHVPMGEVPARIGELDASKPLVVLCRSGGRSAQVGRYLEQHGFSDVYNLTGGINAWAEELDPTLTIY
ncbi:MAG: sulfurtransferase [Gammaproteobacteria bacterium]|nr:sulfurtransferase [Gammaproteobacteria bacterium]